MSFILLKRILIQLKTTVFTYRIKPFGFYFLCKARAAREAWLGERKSYTLRDKFHNPLKNNVRSPSSSGLRH